MSETTPTNEVRRFMTCEEGRQFIEGIRAYLKGHRIEEVTFSNNDEGVTTFLHLSNGQIYAFNDEELCLETLREQFSGLFRELSRHRKEECDEQPSIAP